MTTKLPVRQLWPIWLACLVTGCGTPLGVPPSPASDGTADDSSAESVFEDDADPALASLPFVEGELLVQPYPGADARALSSLYARSGAVVTDDPSEIGVTVLEVPNDQLVAIAVELVSSGLIEEIHKNYIFFSLYDMKVFHTFYI